MTMTDVVRINTFGSALHVPGQGRLTDAARYLQQLCYSTAKYRLD